MTGTSSFTFAIDRDAGQFDVSADYYIPGYDDPETGEQFYETTWNFSFADAAGSYGMSGYGWDSGFGQISLSLAGDTVSDGTLDFYALNTFSDVEARGRFHILNAALAQNTVSLAASDGTDTVLLGGAAADTLTGAAGNDLLDAGGGSDTLVGGTGNDKLDGGTGADSMDGGAGDDTYRVDDAADTIAEADGGGHDLVFAAVSTTLSAHVEDLILWAPAAQDGTGNAEDNAIWGNDGANRLSGLGGDDVLTGYSGDDLLEGGEGSDRLDGGAGADRMVGGLGDDHYVIDNKGDRTVELSGGGHDEARIDGLARYTLAAEVEDLVNLAALPVFSGWGNAKDNVLAGAAGIDRLHGAGGEDTLQGGSGNDLLDGGAGADRLIGGDGIDTASYASAAGPVSVDLAGIANSGDAAGDTFTSIENLVGSSYADTLTGDAADNRLFGGAGSDSLSGGGGRDWLIGGAGADRLAGDGDDGVAYGGSGAAVTVNLVRQTAGGGDATGDVLSGIARVEGSALGDRITGNSAANVLLGGSGADVINAGSGDDLVRGGAGADRLEGGGGVDVLDYAGSAAAVTIDLRGGTASGGDAAGDVISGFERVSGSAHDDRLVADDPGGQLDGAGGDDTLIGGAGRDVLIGGAGADHSEGGGGSDTLSYATSRSYVSVNLATGNVFGADAAGDTFSGIENLVGGRAADALYGDDARNWIGGGAGGDYIDGAGGNDVLVGGSGDDAFLLSLSGGVDRIRDFAAGGTEDRLVVDWGSAFGTVDALLAAATQDGADTVIMVSAGVGVVLEGVNKADLTAADFVF